MDNTLFNGEQSITFAYDAVGQVISLAHLNGAGTTLVRFVYGYDPVGNRDSIGDSNGAGTNYTYDAKNRLTRDATVSTYTYTGYGLRRSAQEPGGSLTTFVWDGSDYLQERS